MSLVHTASLSPVMSLCLSICLSLYVCLCVCVSVCLYVCLCVGVGYTSECTSCEPGSYSVIESSHVSVSLFTQYICLCMSVCMSMSVSVYVCVGVGYTSECTSCEPGSYSIVIESSHVSVCVSVYVCLSVCGPCLCVCLYVCLSVCVSVCGLCVGVGYTSECTSCEPGSYSVAESSHVSVCGLYVYMSLCVCVVCL